MNYSNENRGSIQYRARRQQLIDFSGLRFGNITPTDCDGLIEYHNKAFIFFEIKYRDAKVPEGQQKAFMRNVDALRLAGKAALFIIAEHEVDDSSADINAVNCKVREFYDGTWKNTKETLKEVIERFIQFVVGRQPS